VSWSDDQIKETVELLYKTGVIEDVPEPEPIIEPAPAPIPAPVVPDDRV
jgi:hypothetical protein